MARTERAQVRRLGPVAHMRARAEMTRRALSVRGMEGLTWRMCSIGSMTRR